MDRHLGLEHELVNDVALFQDFSLGFWQEKKPSVYYGVYFCNCPWRQPVRGVRCASRERQGDATRRSDQIRERGEGLVFGPEFPRIEVL